MLVCLSIPVLVLHADGWSPATSSGGAELNCWAELLGGSNQGGLAAAKEISQSGKCLKQKREDLLPDLLVRDAAVDKASQTMTTKDWERAWQKSPWTT